MAPWRPQSAPALPSCLEGPQGRVSRECPPSQCCSDRSQGLGGDPGAWGLCRVQARLCALIPSPLFLSQGFQGKTGPPGPPGVVGPQVRLPPTPRRDKASQTLGVGTSASLLPSPDPGAPDPALPAGPLGLGCVVGAGFGAGIPEFHLFPGPVLFVHLGAEEGPRQGHRAVWAPHTGEGGPAWRPRGTLRQTGRGTRGTSR